MYPSYHYKLSDEENDPGEMIAHISRKEIRAKTLKLEKLIAANGG